MSYNIEKIILDLKTTNKSSIFLYPLLQLAPDIKPIETYLGFEGFEDRSILVCLFHISMERFPVHLKSMEKHPMFDLHISDDDYHYVIFDFTLTPKVYNAVKTGNYSTIDGNARTILTLKGGQMVQLGLNPEAFYHQFAEQFEHPIELVQANVELVSPPDIQNEYLHINNKIKEIIADAY